MTDVLLVAPYSSVLAGLRSLLATFAEFVVVGEARNMDALADLAYDLTPGVVVYDASTRALKLVLDRLHDPEWPIVVLSDDIADARALLASHRGSWSALRRDSGAHEIAAGIRAAAAGIIGIDPAFADALSCAAPPAVSIIDSGVQSTITPREREVLQLMAQGLPNKVIAARLGITLSTAKFHAAAILARLGASSRTEAVTIGARIGLVTL